MIDHYMSRYEKGLKYAIYEYASGGSLYDLCEKNPNGMSEVKVKKYFSQMLSGVDHIHKNNIIHRDLKPESIMLDNMDNIKIACFGYSTTYSKDKNVNYVGC